MKRLFLVISCTLVGFSCARKTIENPALISDMISVMDFGAIPNDGKDDSRAIQAALDKAIKDPGSSRVYCPPGVYDLEKGVLITRKNKTEYDFVTLTLSGHISAYSAIQALGSTTVFRMKHPTLGVGVQSARNVVIENIVFKGCAT